MVYVTGDLHGEYSRFQDKAMKQLKKGDILLVCGDFGFVWDESRQEQKLLQKIGRRRHITLFLDGTHDNLPCIEGYPLEEFAGAPVRHICGNLYYAQRGSVFTLEGKTVFVMGGGISSDMEEREEGKTWWSQEQPTLQELRAAEEVLQRYDGQVDYIVTHQPPEDIRRFITGEEERISPLGNFLNQVQAQCGFTHWYFGELHRDKVVPPRYTAVFQAVLPLK